MNLPTLPGRTARPTNTDSKTNGFSIKRTDAKKALGILNVWKEVPQSKVQELVDALAKIGYDATYLDGTVAQASEDDY